MVSKSDFSFPWIHQISSLNEMYTVKKSFVLVQDTFLINIFDICLNISKKPKDNVVSNSAVPALKWVGTNCSDEW